MVDRDSIGIPGSPSRWYRAGRPFQAALLDLTIPGGLGGKEVAPQLRAIDDRVPLIVLSGYAEDPVMTDPTAHGFGASLCKPFVKADLMSVIDAHIKREKASN